MVPEEAVSEDEVSEDGRHQQVLPGTVKSINLMVKLIVQFRDKLMVKLIVKSRIKLMVKLRVKLMYTKINLGKRRWKRSGGGRFQAMVSVMAVKIQFWS